MNYIYDIVLNFNEILYDQFDWSKKDNIERIKKIPLYRIGEDDLKNIISNKIQMYIKDILNKTDLYNNKKNKTCCLFTDTFNVVAVEFDSMGNSIKKSYLDILEESDVLDISNKYNVIKLDYKIKKKDIVVLKTRKEYDKLKDINKRLENISKDKLKYLYFECSNIELNDYNNLKENIKKILNTPEDIKYKKLMDTIELITNKK